MTKLTQEKSNQVVRNLSIINIPEDVLRNADITGLVRSIHDSQKKIEKGKKELKDAQKAYEEGNIFGNFFNSREDAIKMARENLALAVGDLTSQSSKLMVFNTAISKVLLEQQSVLEQQQEKLEVQANQIIQQNNLISLQQEELNKTNKELIEQQKEINKANQGLMEAKGISQEQAMKLVNVVENTRNLKNELEDKVNKFSIEIENQIVSLQEDNDQIRTFLLDVIETRNNEALCLIENKHSLLEQSYRNTILELEKDIDDFNKLNSEKIMLITNKINEVESKNSRKSSVFLGLSIVNLCLLAIFAWFVKSMIH